MAFLRKANKKRFEIVDFNIIKDDNLSLKDLGLLIKLLSFPDNWEFSEKGLMSILKKDKQASIRTALKNLESLGYLKRTKIRDPNGKYIGCDWIINENPYLGNPNLGNPNLGNPNLDKPHLENQLQYNIKESNIEKSNIKESNNLSIYLTTDYLKEILEYDKLINAHLEDKDMIDGIIDIIYDVLTSKKKFIKVNKEEKPANVVQAKFRKINGLHIEYVINCMNNTTSDIKNIRSYLITALYNSTSTIDNFYNQKINYDLNK